MSRPHVGTGHGLGGAIAIRADLRVRSVGMPDTFRCAHCGGMFEKGSDADADAEALERFGVAQASADPSMVEVCEDCYKAMTTTLPPHAWRRHQGN